MSDVQKALETQLQNIQKKTGKSLDQLKQFIADTGLTKHGEIRDVLKRELGLGHGDANTLVHVARPAAAELGGDPLDEIYSGTKAHLRPIHEALMSRIEPFGEFEVAPKKGYVSLRRKKQFAMIGPATQTRVEVGLNMKGVEATDRLAALPPKGMCDYKVKVTGVEEVDAELVGWLRRAFEAAG